MVEKSKESRLTQKQKMLLHELPRNNYNFSKSAIKAGYKENYANTSLATDLRKSKNMKEFFTEDTVKRDIKRVKKLVLKKEDYTNYLRATELESKILGMQLDKSEITNKNPDKIILIDRERHTLPSENRVSSLIPDEKPTSLIENKINGQ